MSIWERFGNFLSLVCELRKFKDIPSGEVQANGESLLKEGFEIAERLLESTEASRPSGPPTGISEKQSAVQHATRHTDTGRPKTRRSRRLTEAAWKKKVAEQTQSQQSSEHCNAGCPKGSAGRGRKQKVQQPRDVFSEGMRKAPGAHGNANRSGERGKASRRGFGSNHSNSSGRSQQWRRPERGTERERRIIPPGTPEKEFRVREGDVDWVEETLGDGGVRVRSHGSAQSGVSNQSQQQTDVQVSGVREGSVPVSFVGATLAKTPSMTFDFSQSSQKEGRGTWEVQEGSGIVNADGGVFFVTPRTTFDFSQSSPGMAPAGGDGQMNEPAPMELCRIERSKKDEEGVGKGLFESLYGVGSWELREQIHCQSERLHSPSPQLNRLETGGQGNNFGGGSPGKAERQKQKRQEKRERKRQEKHEREMLAVRQTKETDSPWSLLPPISEGVEGPAVSSDGLTPSRQAKRQQERTEAKNKEKERRRAAHRKPKTPVPPRNPLQHEFSEDVSFRFWLGREDLIPNVQRIGTADWDAVLARRGCGQTGKTFYREMYGNGGSVMPCVPEVRPAVRQMRSMRTARTPAQSSISPQPPSEQ